MPLTISITGYVPPVGVPLTQAALRKLTTGFTVSISGTVSGGEVVDGSITPSKVSPGAYFYGTATWNGTDRYTVTLTPPLSAYADGVRVYFKAPADNGDSAVKANVSGLGEKLITKRNFEALWGGEIRQGNIVELIYNSSGGGGFQLISAGEYPRRNFALTTGTVDISNRCKDFTVPVGNAYPTPGSISAQAFFCRLHSDCDSAPTLKLWNDAYELTWLDGRAIAQNQLRKGQVIGFMFDSNFNKFVLLGEQPNGLWGANNTGTANAWVASVPGFPDSNIAGTGILIKAPAANTSAVTLSVTVPATGTAHGGAVVKHHNRALSPGDIKANAYYVVVNNGTNWVLQTPTAQPVVMAMANFDGTAATPITPRDSYNIDGTAKVTKHATGDYTVNFATALPSANYQAHVTIGGTGNPSSQGFVYDAAVNQLAGSVRIRTGSASTGTLADFPYVYVTIIGFP